MKLRKLLLPSLVAAALLPGVASAQIDFRFNYAAGDAAEGYVSGVHGALSPVTDELKYTAESVVAFDTLGNPFVAGVTFTDYIVLRVDQLFNNSINVTNTGYGGPGGDQEITVKAKLFGVQTSPTTYNITGAEYFDVYYDSGDNVAAAYTFADFASLVSFSDGTKVETAGATGAGVNAPNIPDGAINLTLKILDLLGAPGNPPDFEVDAAGNPFTKQVFMLSDSNNNRCKDSGGLANCVSVIDGLGGANDLITYFGVATAGKTLFHTKSDGSATKDLPEPATLGLLGMGLLGMGWVTRRRKA